MAFLLAKPRKTRKIDFTRPFRQLPELAALLIKRQRHYSGLTLLALLDIIFAVALTTNASFFSQAVDRAVLLQELKSFTDITGRPPFSTTVYTYGSRTTPLTLERVESLTQPIASILARDVGLPLRQVNVDVSAGGMMILAPEGSPLAHIKPSFLTNLEAVYVAGIAPEMDIVEGRPMDGGKNTGKLIDVWIHEKTAQTMGIQVGEKINLGQKESDPNPLTLQVAGIWRAKNPKSEFWFSNPDSSMVKKILFRREDYIQSVQPKGPAGGIVYAGWYIILDEKQLVPSQSDQYLAGFERARLQIDKFLPGVRLNSAPLEPLNKFVNRSFSMTVLLLAYNLPAFGILLYFLALTSTMIAAWQRREIGLLVSRGMSVRGILSLLSMEQLILFALGYPLGIGIGMLIAYWMGFTASFLSFIPRDPLQVSLQGLSLGLTLIALAITLLARLLPVYSAAHTTLVSEERERSRPVRLPFWYRTYLDLILMVPTIYAYTQLARRGSITGLVETNPQDLYRDPLLIIVPALFILTAALLTMRLFHFLMFALDWFSIRSPWLTIHMALRQLSRQSVEYVTPLVMVIISLSLGVYTLSMAASLDQWLVDRMYYQAGTDLNIEPLPPDLNTSGVQGAATQVTLDGNWIPIPSIFASLPGVATATRVGDYPARFTVSTGKGVSGRFLAVDRAEFAPAAWWRTDFSTEPLVAMMNRLALAQDAVLVSDKFLRTYAFVLGDQIEASISIPGSDLVNIQLTIVGSYKYLPTVYEDQNPTIIGNFDPLASWLGYTPPHHIWLRLLPGADTHKILIDMQKNLGINALIKGDARSSIAAEQAKLERVGIFGTLSIGFIATAVMAILSLLIYSSASLQERAYRFAVLHAVGLTRKQIMAQVLFEYAFLALFGALAGALIGAAAANIFVPFFRFTGSALVPLPPLLPQVASTQLRNLSAAFGFIIVAAELLTVGLSLRHSLSQMLKGAWL